MRHNSELLQERNKLSLAETEENQKLMGKKICDKKKETLMFQKLSKEEVRGLHVSGNSNVVKSGDIDFCHEFLQKKTKSSSTETEGTENKTGESTKQEGVKEPKSYADILKGPIKSQESIMQETETRSAKEEELKSMNKERLTKSTVPASYADALKSHPSKHRAVNTQ